MATIAAFLSKAWLAVTLALTGVSSSLPAPVQALVPSATPAPQTTAASYPRLQQAWAREQTVYGRLGKFFDNIDQRIARVPMPSMMSTSTTSASSRSAMRWASVAPTLPAPTTVTFLFMEAPP